MEEEDSRIASDAMDVSVPIDPSARYVVDIALKIITNSFKLATAFSTPQPVYTLFNLVIHWLDCPKSTLKHWPFFVIGVFTQNAVLRFLALKVHVMFLSRKEY